MCPEFTKKFSCITEVTREKKFKNLWPRWSVDSWIITHTSFSSWVREWFVMQQKLTETLLFEMSALEHLEGTQCIFLKSQYRAHCERGHHLSFMSPLIQIEVQLSSWERRKNHASLGGALLFSVPPLHPLSFIKLFYYSTPRAQLSFRSLRVGTWTIFCLLFAERQKKTIIS